MGNVIQMKPKTKRIKIWMKYEAESSIEKVVPIDWEFTSLESLPEGIIQELIESITEVEPIDWGYNESQKS